MKKLSVLTLALTLCMTLSACGVAKDSYAEVTTVPYAYSSSGSGLYYATAEDSSNVKMEAEMADSRLNGASTLYGQSETVHEKLVYTSRVTLETEDFDASNESLHNTVASLGGIIVSENASNLNSVNYKGYRTLYMTVRIPQECYDAFLSGLSDCYNVASVNNTVENMTEYYYDSESRLKSLRIQEDRLFSMLEKAVTVKEMLDIESRLCDVQYEIESLTNSLRTIDNNVKYSTFHISLNEVTKYTSPAPKTFGDRLGDAIENSLEAFTSFVEGLLFCSIYFFPYALIILIIVVITVIIAKRSKKKHKKTTNEESK